MADEDVPLKEHIETLINGKFDLLAAKLDALAKQVDGGMIENRRMDDDIHGDLRDLVEIANASLPRSEYEVRHKELEGKIEVVRIDNATFLGKSQGSQDLVARIGSVIAIFVGIIGILAYLSAH